MLTINNFVLQGGVQQLTAEGTVAIGAASARLANDLKVRLNNVQVRDINELMLGQRSLEGVLNGTAEIRGTSSDPRIQADFAVTNGNVQGVTFEALSGKAEYEGKAAHVDVRLQQNPAAFLTAVGTVPVPSGPGDRPRVEAIDLMVKSSPIDIALFQPATAELTKLSGQMQADVHIAGTVESPRFDGQLNVTNAGFTVESTSVVYSNALARPTREGDTVIVERFEVSDNDRDKLVAIGSLGIRSTASVR
jgi:autotransporter translocation and assembly factor TamB